MATDIKETRVIIMRKKTEKEKTRNYDETGSGSDSDGILAGLPSIPASSSSGIQSFCSSRTSSPSASLK